MIACHWCNSWNFSNLAYMFPESISPNVCLPTMFLFPWELHQQWEGSTKHVKVWIYKARSWFTLPKDPPVPKKHPLTSEHPWCFFKTPELHCPHKQTLAQSKVPGGHTHLTQPPWVQLPLPDGSNLLDADLGSSGWCLMSMGAYIFSIDICGTPILYQTLH